MATPTHGWWYVQPCTLDRSKAYALILRVALDRRVPRCTIADYRYKGRNAGVSPKQAHIGRSGRNGRLGG